MRKVKTLIRLGGCPGWSESLRGAQPFCWFCHVAAQIWSGSTKSESSSDKYVSSDLFKFWMLSFDRCPDGPNQVLSPTKNYFIVFTVKVLLGHMSRDMTKPTKWLCAQRRLRSAWASVQSDQSSLSAWRKLGSLATHWAHSEDSDQTGRMPRLIWVFTGRTVILLVLSWGGSYRCEQTRQTQLVDQCAPKGADWSGVPV